MKIDLYINLCYNKGSVNTGPRNYAQKEVAVQEDLTLEAMEALGVRIRGRRMADNGNELRFSLSVGSDGGYIWTEPGLDYKPKWQNAHYHVGMQETYIVARGRMALATQRGERFEVQVYGPGRVVTVGVGVHHNVFLFEGSAIHTVKFGVPVGNSDKNGADWYPADPKFARWTKSISDLELLDLARRDGC